MLTAYWSGPMIIDHYFVSGRTAYQLLGKKYQGLIENKYEIGQIGLSNHYETVENNEKL